MTSCEGSRFCWYALPCKVRAIWCVECCVGLQTNGALTTLMGSGDQSVIVWNWLTSVFIFTEFLTVMVTVRRWLLRIYDVRRRHWCMGVARCDSHSLLDGVCRLSEVKNNEEVARSHKQGLEWGIRVRIGKLEMWANDQRDGRPAEFRWRPLFNAVKFGWRLLLECRAVMLPRCESRNLQGAPYSPTDLSG